MEFKDFYEDFEKGIIKPEYKGEGQKKMWEWIHEHCKHHKLYKSGEFMEDGRINFKYEATDEELLAKWDALENSMKVFMLPGQMRRIGILLKAKAEANNQSAPLS